MSDRVQFITQTAKELGLDPQRALAIARSEGLGGKTGDSGSSFGDFQLHYGGVAKGGNAVAGLGDDYTAKTGKDARDPSGWKDQDRFALEQIAKNGEAAFHGARTLPPAGGPQGGPQQDAGQQQFGGAIVPQVPLPNDPRTRKRLRGPQEAILYIDTKMGEVSGNPRAAGLVAAMQDYRDRIAAASTPMRVGPTDTYVNPQGAETVYEGSQTGGGPMVAGITAGIVGRNGAPDLRACIVFQGRLERNWKGKDSICSLKRNCNGSARETGCVHEQPADGALLRARHKRNEYDRRGETTLRSIGSIRRPTINSRGYADVCSDAGQLSEWPIGRSLCGRGQYAQGRVFQPRSGRICADRSDVETGERTNQWQLWREAARGFAG